MERETHIPIFSPEIELSEIAPIPPEYAIAKQAVKLLQDQGYEAYMIGGAVRDMLMGKTPKDFDVATNASPEQILAVPGFLPTSLLDAANITRVHLPSPDGGGARPVEMEVMTFHRAGETHESRKSAGTAGGGELEEDIRHRDLTINALALDPINNQLIDYVGGLEDLRSGTIRFVGEPHERITEDPVRVVRAVRFKNRYNFHYDPASEVAIRQEAVTGRIEVQPADRLRNELTAILTHPTRRQSLEDLNQLGLLSALLPELAAVPKLFEQTLPLVESLNEAPNHRFAWAALLAKIDKLEAIKLILGRLNFPKRSRTTGHDDQNEILWIIAEQDHVKQLPAMSLGEQRKMMNHPAFPDLFDFLQAKQRAGQLTAEDLAAIETIWRNHQALPLERQLPSLKRDFGLDGGWFMERYGLKQGKEVGLMLKALEERHMNDEFANRGAVEQAADALVQTNRVDAVKRDVPKE